MPRPSRTRIAGLVAAVILAGAAVAHAAETSAPAAPPDAKRIGAAEAKKLVDAGKAIVVDVRGPADYATEHIAGAISIPNWLIVDRLGELPKDKLIVAYCT